MRTAVFPGSFDPITNGHLDIIKRSLPLFDKLYIAIGVNTEKKYHFNLEQRLSMLRSLFEKEAKIEVVHYQGLTVDFCKKVEAGFLLRGLRSSADFDFERPIAQMNRDMSGIETVLLVSDPSFSTLSSTIIKEIIRNKGDVSLYVPVNLDQF